MHRRAFLNGDCAAALATTMGGLRSDGIPARRDGLFRGDRPTRCLWGRCLVGSIRIRRRVAEETKRCVRRQRLPGLRRHGGRARTPTGFAWQTPGVSSPPAATCCSATSRTIA